MEYLSLKNDVLRQYAFYAGVITLKLVLMSTIVGLKRVFNKTYTNPEDASLFQLKVNRANESVERVRRAHLNDLENIPAFWVLGFLYVLTNPTSMCASICFRTFVAARIGHTFAYLNGMFVPRFLCFSAAMVVNVYMAIKVLTTFMF